MPAGGHKELMNGRSDDGSEMGAPVEFARPDLEREHRKGVPEVVLAQGKRPEDVLAIARRFVDGAGRVIISRVDESLWSGCGPSSPDTACRSIARLERS